MRKLFYILCVGLIVYSCNPGVYNSNKKTDQNSPGAINKQILTRAILFKAASRIQETYLEKNPNCFKNAQGDFFVFLEEITLSKKNITSQRILSFSAGSIYAECAKKILHSDHSHWTIKNILQDHQIPPSINNEEKVLVNPYIFLPDPIAMEKLGQNIDVITLWHLFYTAILLEENQLFEKTYSLLIKKVAEEYPQNRETFENIFNIHKGYFSQQYNVRALACYYLITGNLDTRLQLIETDDARLKQVIDYYDEYYYQTSYITVNDFTLENRFFMWLAARQQEQQGNINKANVFIKTTFDNDILLSVEDFHPNNQVYLYATIRIALQIHSPAMYRYVIGALDPLTKLNETKFKALLKTQLLQLIH